MYKRQGIKSESAASILKQESKDQSIYAVSDPTFEQKTITFTLDGNYELAQSQDGIVVSNQNDKTTIEVNTEQTYGKSIVFALKQKAKAQDNKKEENENKDDQTNKEDQNKPSGGTSDQKEDTPKKEESHKDDVDTGDHSNPILPAGIAIVSFGAMVEIYRVSRKKRKS